ncbi:NfeD family protein [Pseudomonas sp. MWU12-2323]|uniref:NfeD family protein n=1 Tax=Pseudomonas sp. MWU12-2323 TaxID=2651296 RepID=UPI00128D3C33|nr:NfeD family protein [Pseudomonas sp. MWU12-2323]MPQ71452.1 NfeD family protein [Pseudomonas sp. MWU12-2323]
MLMEWWVWIVLGFALIVMETFTVTLFVLWFGIGAVLVGLLTLAWSSLPIEAQLLSWATLSSLLTVLWFKVFKNRIPEKRWTADEVIGEVGLLTASVAEFQKGRVRFQKPVLGNEEWVCISNSDIASGTRVRIVAIEGNMVRVDLA